MMEENTKKESEKLYLIESEITQRPYLDENRHAIVFQEEEEAKKYASATEHTRVREEEADRSTLYSMCYAAGAVKLEERASQNVKYNIDITKENVKREFYNPKTNAIISRYMHTKESACLKQLAGCRFIVPVRITNRPSTEIVYATMYKSAEDKKRDKYCFIAFSDLEEYEKWTGKDNGWVPLLVNCGVMLRIGRKRGFVLNLYTSRMRINGTGDIKFFMYRLATLYS